METPAATTEVRNMDMLITNTPKRTGMQHKKCLDMVGGDVVSGERGGGDKCVWWENQARVFICWR
jgi:hypothetical protein